LNWHASYKSRLPTEAIVFIVGGSTYEEAKVGTLSHCRLHLCRHHALMQLSADSGEAAVFWVLAEARCQAWLFDTA
jgi:hypothetical protein